MGDLIARLSAEGPQVWRQLSLPQKLSLSVVALAAVAAVFFLTTWAQRPEYSAAFTGLSESDAATVVAKLKELKIPYELADGGATVRVPSDKVYDVRLHMASQGLPKGGATGFELFDKMSFGLTDFAQKLNYQRALEGELSRTIGRISGVEEARVHIVLPQNELFAEREKPATASVVLSLKPGTEMDSRQVRGIVNLVSRSVAGLKPENVTVVDSDGTMLSGQEDVLTASASRTEAQRDAQRSYERALQRDIQAMLEQVLGPRKAVVRVSATIDWDQYEWSSETYSPSGKPIQIRSSREVVERSATPLGETGSGYGIPSYPLDGRSPAGPVSPEQSPGTNPGDQARAQATPQATTGTVAASAADPKYERREVTTNYEVSKLVERTVKAPGAVKRLSVSVMLDGEPGEALVSTITNSVTAAAGLDPARGDTIVVAGLPFDKSVSEAQARAEEELSRRDLYTGIARGAIVVISLLVILLLVRSAIRGLTRSPQLSPARAGVVRDSRPPELAGPKGPLPEDEVARRAALKEVTDLAKSQPKVVAQVIKSWLEEK